MHLLIVILILIVWVIYGAMKAVQPANPPIEDMDQHLKEIQMLPNQKARQKYLKNKKK